MRLCSRCKAQPCHLTYTYCKECRRAYKREYYARNQQHLLDRMKETRVRTSFIRHKPVDPRLVKAHNAVQYKLKTGICIQCGFEGYTEWHHPDYDQPTLVEELCNSCHGKKHRKVNNES